METDSVDKYDSYIEQLCMHLDGNDLSNCKYNLIWAREKKRQLQYMWNKDD